MNEQLEPPRLEPDFHVHIMVGNLVRAKLHGSVLQDVYDIAVNSMDFGSGFLSTEEVGNLRKLGNAIGAERFDYQHDKCLRCAHDYERHYQTRKVCSIIKCKCTSFIAPEGASLV